MNLEAWEKQPELKQDQIRLLWPDGRVWNLWKYQLDDALDEEIDKPRDVFYSREDWESFLREQRLINAQWALRQMLTGEDTKLLRDLGVSWSDRTEL